MTQTHTSGAMTRHCWHCAFEARHSPSPHFPWTLPRLACGLTHTPPEQSSLRSVSKDTPLPQKPEMLWMMGLFWDKWSLFLWWFFRLSRKYFRLSPQYLSFPQLSSSWRTPNASSAGSGGQSLGPLGLGCPWSCSSGFFSCSYEDTSSCSCSTATTTSTYAMMHFSHMKIWADIFLFQHEILYVSYSKI